MSASFLLSNRVCFKILVCPSMTSPWYIVSSASFPTLSLIPICSSGVTQFAAGWGWGVSTGGGSAWPWPVDDDDAADASGAAVGFSASPIA